MISLSLTTAATTSHYCSLLVPSRSRHPVCGILCTYTLAQQKLSLPSNVD